jgi:hypothetical protein
LAEIHANERSFFDVKCAFRNARFGPKLLLSFACTDVAPYSAPSSVRGTILVAEAIVVVVVNLVVDGIAVAVVGFAVILVDIGNVVVVGVLEAFPVVLVAVVAVVVVVDVVVVTGVVVAAVVVVVVAVVVVDGISHAYE